MAGEQPAGTKELTLNGKTNGLTVSVIVPTRNSARTLTRCLQSIRCQTYPLVETVVIDNHSDDGTQALAARFTDRVVLAGPERSSQRNHGATCATGEILVFIDSDMVLDSTLVAEIVDCFGLGRFDALVLPERVVGDSFWTQCRALEKRAYLHDPSVEAARAFRRSVFTRLGGYDESLTGPEDWELPDRLRRGGGRIGRTVAGVEHDESGLTLRSTFQKKRYYGLSMAGFLADDRNRAGRIVRPSLLSALLRAGCRRPDIVLGLTLLKSVEFAGIWYGVRQGRRHRTTSPAIAASSALIISHELFEDGAAQALERYLFSRLASLQVCLLPFEDAPERRVARRGYEHGRRKLDRRIAWGALDRWPFSLIRDVLTVLWVTLRSRRRVDIVFAVDPLNGFLVLLARRLSRSRFAVVLYSIDFVPKRFQSRSLNSLYHLVDEVAYRCVDVVWNVSPGISSGRRRRRWHRPRSEEHVVPIGIDVIRSEPLATPTPRLAFVGHLLEKQGVQHAIEALPGLLNTYPHLRLVIIGSGPFEPSLRALARATDVERVVDFMGYVSEGTVIHRILSAGGIGLALYEDYEDSFTRFADPTKLKTYASAALPMIVSDVPAAAAHLILSGAAVGARPDGKAVEQATRMLLSDPERYQSASIASWSFARDLSWTTIFQKALDASDIRIGRGM